MERLPIELFASAILGRELYPYQITIAHAILDSVINNRGLTFTCLLSRQAGKNEVSSIIEAYLLFCMKDGCLVKAAPSYKPQVINSRLRLLRQLEAPLIRNRVWSSFGYIIGLAPTENEVEIKSGPRVMLFSASNEANVVGATASLLLEIDEAQDVSPEVYDVKFKPMGSTANTTTVLWGTSWSDTTLLQRQINHNLELEEQDGIRRHFQYDWTVLAALNPQYKAFVENEIARLGEDHISIRTQYRLLTIKGGGYLLNELQQHLIQGDHSWSEEPDEEGEYLYVAGLDIGGEERAKPGQETAINSKRDATVLTIARVSYNELDLPKIEIVHQQLWTGWKYLDQYAALSNLIQRWNIRRLVIDKTGLGEGMASLLVEKFGDERILPFHFSRPSKSKLTFQLLSLVNSGRMKIYQEEDSPSEIYNECWKQLRLARYTIPGADLINCYVESDQGHDDFLMSIMLCGEAINSFTTPVSPSAVIRPRRVAW